MLQKKQDFETDTKPRTPGPLFHRIIHGDKLDWGEKVRTSANALLMNAPSRLIGAFCEAPLVPAFPTFTLVSQRFDTSFLSLALASSRNSKRTQNSEERIVDCDHSTLARS